MTRRIVLFLFLLCTGSFSLYAQSVKVVSTEVIENQTKVLVSYQIFFVEDDKEYTTSLFLSMDGGKSFQPLKAVSGDIGLLTKLPLGTQKVVWDIFKDVEELTGDIVFEIRVETKRIPLPLKQMVMYNYSSSAPFGLTYMRVRKSGYYIRIKSNFTGGGYDYEASENGLTDYTDAGYWEIGDESKVSRLALTGGGVYKLTRKIYVYGGLGYGSRSLLWSYTSYKDDDSKNKEGFAKVTDASYTGVEAEAGLLFFLLPKVPVSFGMNTVNFGFWEMNLGIGYSF